MQLISKQLGEIDMCLKDLGINKSSNQGFE